jgi:TfoX/Sxy family transcriptional regulator of competence genes
VAYDEELADRIRRVLAPRRGVTERRMFGGLSFLVRGHMVCGVVGGELVVRVGPDQYEEALVEPHAREMDFTGRPLRGLLYVARAGVRSDRALAGWVEKGLHFVRTLPTRAQRAGTRRAPRRG